MQTDGGNSMSTKIRNYLIKKKGLKLKAVVYGKRLDLTT